MFKSTIVLALAAAAFSMGATTAQADPVDRRQAATVARHYLSHPVPIAAPAVRGAVDGEAPAYHLFVAEVGANWVLPDGRKIKFLLTADNLFNREYREYTNRFRYYAHDLGRDVRFMLTWEF